MPKKFEFTAPNAAFECSLQARRCAHVNPKTGSQCSRAQYIGSGICWQHLELDHHLKVADSSIPGVNGKGLFAYSRKHAKDAVLFKKGAVVAPYGGEMIDNVELVRRYGRKATAPYAYRRSQVRIENGACSRGVGSIVNTLRGRRNNAKIVPGQSMKIVAAAGIQNGQEITVAYGVGYSLSEPGVSHKTVSTRGPYHYFRRYSS